MKMSKLALAIGALVMAGGAMAQSTATGTGTANASVIAPIAITVGVTLEFGKVVAGSGTVTIAADGTRTDDGGWAASAQKGTYRNATFAVTGEASHTYSISLPNTVVLNGPSSATMTADTFTIAAGTNGSIAGSGATSVGTLDSSGNGDFKVGAALHIGTTQAVGSYTKTYSVIVAYN